MIFNVNRRKQASPNPLDAACQRLLWILEIWNEYHGVLKPKTACSSHGDTIE